MKINVLDKKVYNRIAAGEVVERPYSVVKELVENSIDAGAKNISISIWNGGKDRVEIEDDGCGIEKEELYKTFLPHATSKIADIKDLDCIETLGFRGEALASIASVAKVTILSKPSTQDFGAKIYSEGGMVSEVEDAPSNNGTKITVDNLFFNTPVRAKFLKTTRAEEGDISNIVSRLVLANPFVSFKYYVDDKLVLQSYGGGLEESIIAVYGANTVRNCFKIQTVKNGIGINGYIGKHDFSKPNRTYQTLIINGRYVINSTVSSAMQNAYQAYLMKRQYPFYVLELNIPTEAVDVNVHPNKTDVRFSNNQIIYGAVYSVVSKVLDGVADAVDIVKNYPDTPFVDVDNIDNKPKFDDNISKNGLLENTVNIKSQNFPKMEKTFFADDFSLSYTKVMDSGATSKTKGEREKEKQLDDIFNENKKYIEELEKKISKKVVSQQDIFAEDNAVLPFKNSALSANNMNVEEYKQDCAQTNMEIESEFVYVGQAMKTYLIFERSGDLYFIDQHAAHERLLFDKLYNDVVNGEVVTQPLLIPFILNLNSIESGYLLARIEYLRQLGFIVEEFGVNTFKITEVPIDVSNISLDKFFSDLLGDNSLRQEKIPEIIREKLCQRACKAAIKAGYDLSKTEIDALMRKLDGNMGLKCPHGRPIAVRITGTEIEKWFKRIV